MTLYNQLNEICRYENKAWYLVGECHKTYYIRHKRRNHYFYSYGDAVNYTCGKKWNGRYKKLPLNRILEYTWQTYYRLKLGDQYIDESGEVRTVQ